jgi:hypothetical protein
MFSGSIPIVFMKFHLKIVTSYVAQNGYKVLEITLSEWLVNTLLNIKYLDFLFNDEILSSCISHQ